MNLENAMRIEVMRCQPSEGPNWGNLPKMFSKDGKPVNMDRLLVKYKKAVKGGWKCEACGDDMKAKSAPGWEGTIKRMKEDHPEIDNP